MTFDDGRDVTLPDDVEAWDWSRNYPQIAAAPHGRAYKFEQFKIDPS